MSHYHEQFLKQNPLAVLGVLRDLHKAAIPLRLSWNGGQLISKLLAITPDKLVLDFGSQAEDNIAVLKAQHITITAETQGAKVEFTVEQLQQSEYLQLPAFITVPPPTLWFVQRRNPQPKRHNPHLNQRLLRQRHSASPDGVVGR